MSPHAEITTNESIILAIVKTLIAIAGGIVTYYAFKAYRRTRQHSLGLLALGFGIITFGVLIAGLLNELTTLGRAIIAESLIILVGFVVIAYSLYPD